MKILVTGGAGFIGSHLVDTLIDKGHEVIVIDNFSTGKRENLHDKAVLYQFSLEENELRLYNVFKTEKIDFIYHLAAIASVPKCSKKPYLSHQVNVNVTVKLLELAAEFKVKGLVFASSAAVYGEIDEGMFAKETMKVAPLSLYGLQKYTSEQYVKHYAGRVPTASCRFFNVYGTMRQSPDGPYSSVITSFYKDKKEKSKLTIYGKGDQVRDFIHVFDVVEALVRFLSVPPFMMTGRVYNVGTGKALSVQTIANYFNCPIEYEPKRLHDIDWSVADIGYITDKILWEPRIPIDEGLQIYFNSFKSIYETPVL